MAYPVETTEGIVYMVGSRFLEDGTQVWSSEDDRVWETVPPANRGTVASIHLLQPYEEREGVDRVAD